MKRVLIFLSMILSLNVFAGVINKNIDMRIQGKLGAGIYPGANIGGELTVKSNVYKSKKYSVYVGGEASLSDVFVIGKGYKLNYINIVPSFVVGIEEKYKNMKFYQQLELGLGYSNYYKNIQRTLLPEDIGNFFGFNLKDNEKTTLHSIDVVPAIELGMNYRNILFSLELEPNVIISNGEYGSTLINIILGVGYEF